MAIDREREFPAALLLIPTVSLFVALAVARLGKEWLSSVERTTPWFVVVVSLLVAGTVAVFEAYAIGIGLSLFTQRKNRTIANIASILFGAVGFIASALIAFVALNSLMMGLQSATGHG
jgi:hypothetical protein